MCIRDRNKTCPGFSQTYILNLDWKAGAARNYFRPFTAGSVGVVSFVTPATPSVQRSRIDFAEAASPPTFRLGTISETPCDFSNYLAGKSGTTVSMSMNVSPSTFPFSTELKPNTRYYINIVNRRSTIGSADTCDTSICDLLVDFYP